MNIKTIVSYVLVFAIVIVAWGIFAHQRRTAPAQTIASLESRPAISDRQTIAQSN